MLERHRSQTTLALRRNGRRTAVRAERTSGCSRETTAMSLKAIGMLTVLVASVLAFPLPSGAQEAIFIVRHSDPPPVLRLDEISDDTPLSESGQQRAAMLAGRLKDAGISAIYATEARLGQSPRDPDPGACVGRLRWLDRAPAL